MPSSQSPLRVVTLLKEQKRNRGGIALRSKTNHLCTNDLCASQIWKKAPMKRAQSTAMETSPSLRVNSGQVGRQHSKNFRNQGKASRLLHPPARSQSRPATSVQPQGGMEIGGDSAFETVLFVSSDDYFRSMMRAYLEHVGYNVLSCAEPGQALPRFFRGAGIHLALIDMHALGPAAAILLASQLTESRADLPVILIAGPDAEKEILLQIEQKGWKCLTKPLLLPELLEIIHRALGPRQPAPPVQEISRPSPSAKGSPRADSRRRTAAFSLPSSSGWLKVRSVLLKAPEIVP
jgi:DNA-binding response OmpR family regulator